MTTYINKDINERLDYAIVASIQDPITTVIPEQPVGATVQLISCTTNATTIRDSAGNEYPPKSCIIFWLDGGVADTVESMNLTWYTLAGRRFDEKFVFRLVEDY